MIFEINTEDNTILITEKIKMAQLDSLLYYLTEDFLNTSVIMFDESIKGSPFIHPEEEEILLDNEDSEMPIIDITTGVKVTDLLEKTRKTKEVIDDNRDK